MKNPPRLLAFPLKSLNRVGSLSEKKHSNMSLLIISIIMGSVLFDLMVLIAQFFYIQDDFEHYVLNCNGVAFFIQGFTKWIFSVYYKNKIIDLSKYKNIFWKAKECPNATQRNIEKLSKFVLFIQKMYTASMALAALLGCISAIYTKEFVTGYWSMGNKNVLFKIAWISLLINSNIITFILSSYDGLFFGFCYEAIMQCKILCDRLKRLSVKRINENYNLEKYLIEMKSCMKHHMLILRFHSELQNIFSVPLLVQYITIVPYIIVQMYTLSNLSSFDPIMYLVADISVAVFQVAIYCISANHLTNELSSIGDAVYISDWYSQHFSVVSAYIVRIIQRAQHRDILTACGLIEFNRDVLILKFGLSTCITLRNFNKEK